jgi:hypothetical protein
VRGQTISEAALPDVEDALDFAAWDLSEDRSDWPCDIDDDPPEKT